MLSDNHPDRIHVAFDDHRLVANAGLLLPVTLGRHLGLPQLVDRHLGLGLGDGLGRHRRQGDDAGGLCLGGRRLHRRRRRVARWRYGRCHRLRGQGAIRPGYLPVSVLKNVLCGRFSASDDSASPGAPYRRHSSYLYPLWRFLSTIGWVFSSSIACPMYPPTSEPLV